MSGTSNPKRRVAHFPHVSHVARGLAPPSAAVPVPLLLQNRDCTGRAAAHLTRETRETIGRLKAEGVQAEVFETSNPDF